MTTEDANLRHWDDTSKGVYEVWYTTWNHPETGQGFWLRFITEAPVDGPPRAYITSGSWRSTNGAGSQRRSQRTV